MSNTKESSEHGWLIEDQSPSGPAWWRATGPAEGGWTRDASEALRFARRKDAEAVMIYTGLAGSPWVHATEHVFG